MKDQWGGVAFSEEEPIVGHDLLQTLTLVVVSNYQNGTFCVLWLSTRRWLDEAMPVQSAGCNGCILEGVYGIPSVQEAQGQLVHVFVEV